MLVLLLLLLLLPTLLMLVSLLLLGKDVARSGRWNELPELPTDGRRTLMQLLFLLAAPTFLAESVLSRPRRARARSLCMNVYMYVCIY